MRLRTITTPVVCILACALSSGAQQEDLGNAKARAILREASALLPQIDKDQRSSAAANIAGQQARIGDLDDAAATARLAGASSAQVFATGSIAYVLASEGNLPLALALIRNSSEGDDPAKAKEYLSLSQVLADRRDFEHALQAARLINSGPAYFGRTNDFVGALLRVQAKQFEAGDLVGAQETVGEALTVVQWEKEHPFDPWFAETMPAGLYASIAGELAREGNREAAAVVVERIYGMLTAAATEQARQDLLFNLAEAQVGIGELDAATASAAQLPPGNPRGGIVLRVGIERAKAGDLSGALDDATALSYEPWRNGSFRDVADRFSALGNDAQALAVLDLIPEPAERASGLAELASQQAGKDDSNARITLDLAYEAAMNAGAETKPYVFELIAVTHGVLGDFGAAEEMIGKMKDASKVWPLWNLTKMLIDASRESEAISLAEVQTAPHPKAYALLGVATGLINKKRETADHYLNTSP